MIDGFQAADYALCGLTLVMAVMGLFRGFSGTLGFILAVVLAGLAASFGWLYSASVTTVVWQRAAGVIVATLLTFGLVRLVVKKIVGGILAGPSDALFGLLVGVLFGVIILTVWARSGIHLEYSSLARDIADYVR